MAQNLMGQTRTNRSDTISEHLEDSSLTGNARFQAMRTAQKLDDKGTSVWQTLRSSLGVYNFVTRLFLTRRIAKR